MKCTFLNFTFDSTVRGEDGESLWRMFILVMLCVLFGSPAGPCASACLTPLPVAPRRRVSVRARVAVRVLSPVRRGGPSIAAQGPFDPLQHLQHQVHHDEMSVLLHRHTETLLNQICRHY